jgi:hypothetical protein
VVRPRRKERFARLIQRRVRAFALAEGRRRLRRQSQPDLVARQGSCGRLRPDVSKRPIAGANSAWPREGDLRRKVGLPARLST